MKPINWIFSFLCVIFSTLSALIFVKYADIVPSEDAKMWSAVYVINLDRRPDRYQKVHALLDKSHIQHTRFSAVDGYKLRFKNPLWKRRFIIGIRPVVYYPSIPEAAFRYDNMPFKRRRRLTPGELGCIYSHRAVWQDIVNKKCKMAIIFEDDIVIERDFKKALYNLFRSIPIDAELVFIDFLYFSLVTKHFVEDRSGLTPKVNGMFVDKIYNSNVWGTHAYAVTLNGAKKLLQITNVLSVPVDAAIDLAMKDKRIRGYMNVKRIVRNQWSDSDITEMGR